MKKKLVSIVLPAHNEAGNIEVIHERIKSCFPYVRYDLELIFVDDGSTDDTLERIIDLSNKWGGIFYIELSRNFGHQNALKAGLDESHGDCVISMDCDLQHPPEIISKLLSKWEEGFDIVYTRREESENLSYLKRKTSNGFYAFISWLSGIKIEKGTSDFRLMDRRVTDLFTRFKENDLFIRGLIKWVGFKQVAIDFHPDDRHSGSSKYTFRKMLKFAFNGVTSLSIRPLYVAVYLGFIISLLSFLYLPYVIWSYYYSGHYSYGWGSVILTVAFFSGLQLCVLGIIGIYIGKMFMQVKDRPLYIVKSTNLKSSE
ncbi:MAG: glycosyltransferase family 2 protein [Prolixibacteraceae bacterium]|jgi:dolichol-phosphate mannosyltransferase|nr:glycosyltransferase family 2 protein [Prolixibacteraceae bacterium]